MVDTHVHSNFSADSDMDLITACDEAINTGLDGITFTDHLDLDYPDFDDGFLIDFEKYDRAVKKLKQDYDGRIKVLKGIEVGIMPHTLKESQNIVKAWNFDYIIGSVHIIDGMDPYKQVYYRDKSIKEAYTGYLESILFTVGKFDDFNVMGHIDYIIRKAIYPDRSLRYTDFSEIMDEIFRCLIAKGKGMEINTSSYRELPGLPTPIYDIKLLTRFLELGGEIITLGSDAHSPEYLGCRFPYFKEMLKTAGYRFVAYFEAGKPIFEPL